jgi:hypothetical protein
MRLDAFIIRQQPEHGHEGEQGMEVMFAFNDCKPSGWAKALAMQALYCCKGPARVTPVFSDYQRLFPLTYVGFTLMLPLRMFDSAFCVRRSRTRLPRAIMQASIHEGYVSVLHQRCFVKPLRER